MRDLEQGVVLFSRYKITGLLGSGGAGSVYLSKDLKVGTLVAIKVVPRSNGRSSLIAERELLKELRHSAIPIIIDIEEDEDCLYLVEEYVEGAVLSELKMKLNEEDMMDIMLQLCDVLLYLHTSQNVPIIYRDLKPDNIIRMPNGRIKLVDFGIAEKYSDKQLMNHYGTRGYAAPEQLSSAKSNEKTDIFALGVTIYFMLTGKNMSIPPYRLKPIREVLPELSQEFAAIISKCIETLPGKRYPSVEHIISDLTYLGKQETGEHDFSAFKDHSRKTVTVAGVRRGIGTTYLTYLIALYYAEQGYRVALVEWMNRNDLLKMASLYPEAVEGRSSFRMKGIDFFSFDAGRNYHKSLEGIYDRLIVDAGCYEEMTERGGYELSDELFVICGARSWEIDYFEDIVYSSQGGRFKFLFNLTEPKKLKRIAKEISGVHMDCLPYHPDGEVVSEAMKASLKRILLERDSASDEVKGGWRHVKAYIENQIARFAQG